MLRRRRRGGRTTTSWGPGISWLDLKLGVRMLRRSPGLTVVAVIALGIGIPASLIPIHWLDAIAAPLPFEEGDRIVGIRNVDVSTRRPQLRSVHDYFVWRDELTTFESVGAARRGTYNVFAPDGSVAPVRGAEVSASSFRITRVPPHLGRVLLESDELPGAPDVVVISHEWWRTRMAADPDVVGQAIEIGTRSYQVVGVMPDGYLFPWREHMWFPLRDRPTDFEWGGGPELAVFGRLADGVTIEEARLEVETVGARLAAEHPDSRDGLRTQVLGFADMTWGGALPRAGIYLIQLFSLALLMVVCGNVGTLILARTAWRSEEMAVRTALGASRTRIVSQLFVESLVLSAGAAGLGLLLADAIAVRFQAALAFDMPFWLDFGVKLRTVVLALSVAALCAVVAGILPALRATGRGMGTMLQGAAARSGLRFGRASSVLIAVEVALTVGFMTLGATLTYALVEYGPPAPEIDTDEYLMVELSVPWTEDETDGGGPGAPSRPGSGSIDEAAYRARVAAVVTDLRDRLAVEPEVRAWRWVVVFLRWSTPREGWRSRRRGGTGRAREYASAWRPSTRSSSKGWATTSSRGVRSTRATCWLLPAGDVPP